MVDNEEYDPDLNKWVYYYDIYRIDNNGSDIVANRVTNNIVYPNPVRRMDSLIIELDNAIADSDIIVEIIDLRGRIIARRNTTCTENKISIPMRRLNNGQYIYNIVSNGKVINTGKLIVR